MSEIDVNRPSAALIAFAARAPAFREPERAMAREIVLATLLRAAAHVRAPRVVIAAGGNVATPARLHARAIGHPEMTTPLRAAFLSALAAGDDPSLAAPVVCAALAIGESVDASGESVLDAIIAGLEVAVRVERSLGAGHATRGWDARGTCGRIGAAIAAARVLALQPEAMCDAFGIATTTAAGLRSAADTMTAPAIVAEAAADGVEAALLARAEFTGALLPLEGRRGLATLMTATFDPGILLDGLGETFVFGTERAIAHASAANGFAELRELVGKLEHVPSIRPVIDATMPAR